MTVVFADTFYWVALTNTQDSSHERALKLTRSLGDLEIVTSETVVIEYLNFFADWGESFRRKAAENVQNMLVRPSVRVLPHTPEAFRTGFELYSSRPDKGYSLTDCVSMAAMRRERLNDALTNDRHFEQEGFRALFRE